MNIDVKKNIIKQCLVEFFGTGLIVFFGISCLAASKLTDINFSHFEISLVWGLGVSISIYFSLSISGAHLNPAITIFLWLSSKFNKRKVFPYIFSQIFGAFIFAILVYYLYYDILIIFEKKYNITRGTQESLDLASIFCAYPSAGNNFIRDFIIEMFSSAFFMIIISQFNNKNNNALYNRSLTPLLIGALITIINLSISPLYNISLNPARDLGPRIFLSLIGWGLLSFTGGSGHFLYFLIPIIGSILGVNLGGWTYKLFIENSFLKKCKE